MTLRRLAAGSCLAAALLFGTACSGDDGASTKSTGAAATSSASTVASSDTSLSSDTELSSDTTISSDTVTPDDSIGPDDTGAPLDTSVDELDTAAEGVPVDTDPLPMEKLPADGPATVGGVDLPAGTVMVDGDQRLTWITNEVVPDAGNVWLQLFNAYPDTGLYPVLLVNDDQPAGWEQEAFFANQPTTIDSYDVAATLERSAAENFDPPRTSDGPAPASTGSPDPDAASALIAEMPDARIALVETPQAADAIAYMGWTGNATYDSTEALASVVRSWADRYGARVVAVGPASLRIALDNPPTDAEAGALAKELVLVDPDLETGGAPITVTALDDLVGQHMWTLWWLS